jgi:DNA-binding beta-propeller fold protein YncE
MRRSLLAVTLLLAFGGLGVGAQAAGTPGELAYDGCVSNDGSGGSCLNANGTQLSDPISVAISPDGRSVYVASLASNSITHFFATATGQLSYDACFNDDGSSGCTAIAGAPLRGAYAVAVSPNGGSVYVAGASANAVSHFFAGPTGQLSYDGCLSEDGSGGRCANVGPVLETPDGLAVSPSGNSVYVSADDSVVHLFAAPQGQISLDGCISDDGTSGHCVDAPGTPLTLALGVAVSPDGKSVYVGSESASTVTHFFAAPAGQLTYDGCVSNGGSGGSCANAPGSALDGAREVRVSPDGRSVYVVGSNSNAVAHFSAAPAGQLTYQDCVSSDGSGGSCTDVPGSVLNGAIALAISPEGNRIYVASTSANSLVTFTVGPTGQLAYDSCISADGSTGLCTTQAGPALSDPADLAINPAGTALYAVAFGGAAVDHFFRAASPTGSGSGGGGGSGGASSGGGGSTTTALISALALKPVVFGAAPGGPTVITPATKNRKGTLITYQLSAAATVTFTLERPVVGRIKTAAGQRTCVPMTHRNANARHCTRQVAVGSFTQSGTAGANSIRFSGRIGGKKLARGSYTLVATPAGGQPVQAKLKIKH